MQEHYCRDPWRVLVACVLCSRTSGGPTIRNTLAAFLADYPTPTDVIRGDLDRMAALLHPLGTPPHPSRGRLPLHVRWAHTHML